MIIHWVLIIIIIVIVLSLIELYYNIHISTFSYPLPKQVAVITPEITKLNDPMYIYACGKIHRRNIKFLDGFNENLYVKRKIQNHIGDKVKSGITSIVSKIGEFPTSTPINKLYDATIIGTSTLVNADPTTPFKLGIKKYCVLISKKDNELIKEIFTCDTNVYFII
jgi:hypothetical protein